MFVIHARNVNEAYVKGISLLRAEGVREQSRAGEVLVVPYPVTTVYENPRERVLFDPGRDANPFFHLFESLWMLSGQNDATWLDRFVRDFSSRFAEDNGLQHGAYGFRWRRHYDLEGSSDNAWFPDQLDKVVELLKANPYDRRVVLTMWDPVADLGASKRDIPCNLMVIPRVRLELGEPEPYGGDPLCRKFLDITVMCRSNDAIYGAYGANAVHFSVLHEYLATRIGAQVGRYYQISNNFHAYSSVLDRVGIPSGVDPYVGGSVYPVPMFTDPESIDADIGAFMAWTGAHRPYHHVPVPLFKNKWFSDTAQELFVMHSYWRAGQRRLAWDAWYDRCCIAPDWRRAARSWMQRRILKHGG